MWEELSGTRLFFTYISTCVEPLLCGKGIRSGVDQAMKPNMKRSTAPALHASANIGLRPAVDGSIMLAIYYGIRIPKERQEGI